MPTKTHFQFQFRRAISIGDILTICSVLITAAALLYTWNKDQKLRKQEYADRIRHSAGTAIAKLERRRERAHNFYSDILPLFVDSADMFDKNRRFRDTYNFMYRGIVLAHAVSTSKIIDEQIEIAYVDFYSYDPTIKDLVATAVCQLKSADELNLQEFFDKAAELLADSANSPNDPQKADLNNNLRQACLNSDRILQEKMTSILNPLRASIIKFVGSTNDDIVDKIAPIPPVDEIFPSIEQCRSSL